MQGIYKITNVKNGKVYIGQSVDIEKRWAQHKRALELGTHHSTKLQNSYNRHLEDSFIYEIVEEVEDKAELNNKEQHYINMYNSIENGYNMIGVDLYGNLITDKILKEREKKRLKEEYYNYFIDTIEQFGDDLLIEGYTYRNRMMSKHYGHKHYNLVCFLLNYTYSNIYKKGDSVKLDIFGKSSRIRVNTYKWIMFNGDYNSIKTVLFDNGKEIKEIIEL